MGNSSKIAERKSEQVYAAADISSGLPLYNFLKAVMNGSPKPVGGAVPTIFLKSSSMPGVSGVCPAVFIDANVVYDCKKKSFYAVFILF